MKKIPSLFQRNWETDHQLRDEVTPGCEWLLAGEGVATRKWDGTAILIKAGLSSWSAYRRYNAKQGRTPAEGFLPCDSFPDPVTGHWTGWTPATQESPENRWLWEAIKHGREALQDAGDLMAEMTYPQPWTYELCGPKILKNPEGFEHHTLVRHGFHSLVAVPRTFDGIKGFLETANIEGIVFWRDTFDLDCDKVKVKTTDFGLTRKTS